MLDKAFFPDGGKLLIASHHKYSLKGLQRDCDGYPCSILKERDSLIFQVGLILDLAPTFQPIFIIEVADYEGIRYWTADQFPQSVIFSHLRNEDGEDLEKLLMSEEYSAYPVFPDNKHRWYGGPPRAFPLKVADTVVYGNDDGDLESLYVCGTFFLQIPSWDRTSNSRSCANLKPAAAAQRS